MARRIGVAAALGITIAAGVITAVALTDSAHDAYTVQVVGAGGTRLAADEAVAVARSHLEGMREALGMTRAPIDIHSATAIPMSRVGEAIPGSAPVEEDGADPDATVWVINAAGTYFADVGPPGTPRASGRTGFIAIDDASGRIVIVRFTPDY